MESLKPAQVVGVKVDEEKKSALVVVKDDSLSLAIGRKGVNARLAVKLTGYHIDIKVESDAEAEGLEYQTFEELSALDMQEHALKVAEAQKQSLVYQGEYSGALPGLPEGYVAPQERTYEAESNDFDEALEEVAESEELKVTPKEEEKVEEAIEPVEEAPVKEEATTSVKTTTTLEDLEKSLEDSSKSNKKSTSNKRKKKAEEEKEEESVVKHADTPRMSIYTEEELKEMEAEEEAEEEIEEDDIDYDEYDQYYDED